MLGFSKILKYKMRKLVLLKQQSVMQIFFFSIEVGAKRNFASLADPTVGNPKGQEPGKEILKTSKKVHGNPQGPSVQLVFSVCPDAYYSHGHSQIGSEPTSVTSF